MIYIFLADGFEEIEALTCVDIIRRAGLNIKTVGVTGKTVNGAHGIKVIADIEQKDVTTDDMEAIILPGGMPGTLNLEKSPIVTAAINFCIDNKKLISAICAAPSILGHLGHLKNINSTCYPGFENELKGANLSKSKVCTDGEIITANGPGATSEFAFAIVNKLCSKKVENKIRMSMCYE